MSHNEIGEDEESDESRKLLMLKRYVSYQQLAPIDMKKYLSPVFDL